MFFSTIPKSMALQGSISLLTVALRLACPEAVVAEEVAVVAVAEAVEVEAAVAEEAEANG